MTVLSVALVSQRVCQWNMLRSFRSNQGVDNVGDPAVVGLTSPKVRFHSNKGASLPMNLSKINRVPFLDRKKISGWASFQLGL